MTEPRTGTLYWLPTILRDDRLTPIETLLLVAIADHVGADDKAWPSIATLARLARCSYATAQRHLTGLVEKGAISRTQRHRADGGHSTYEYHLSREFFHSPPINLRDPLAQSEGGPLSPGARPPLSLGARAEVPNEPHKEVTATPLSVCARGCLEGYVTKEAAGYSFLAPCECIEEAS